ncbi:MAG TPA: DUF885 domain-containing protein [Mycobacteriales bacterium]|nr:DUF885 domain-containing protein [Mycobacteriales bacterium]
MTTPPPPDGTQAPDEAARAAPTAEARTTPRSVADAYVDALADLDTSVATALGLRPHDDRVPDLSPAGQSARDDLARQTLAALDAARVPEDEHADTERRCAAVLRERLTYQLEWSAAGEHLRAMRNIFGPPQAVRALFTMMPTETEEDWAVVARRMAKVPQAYEGYVASLRAGSERGLHAAPLQVETVVEQLDAWVGGDLSTFHELVAGGPPALEAELRAGADRAVEGVVALRRYLAQEYLPATRGTPDAVGAQRYALGVRASTGSVMTEADLHDAYAWGWSQVLGLREEMLEQAALVLPGASVKEAMEHLDAHGEVVEGVEEVRLRLQQMMDTAIEDLDGEHFDIVGPVRTVEARIAPAGSAAAPYYTRPSVDFSRPGRTWLPTMGRTRFPLWELVSTWYHEGVPGHHLQLAQWVHVAPQLSVYQTTLGSSSAATEGWALYAERLMDELGYLDVGARLGYLDAQMLRAIRVVVDIGMHLELEVPGDSPMFAGERWTPERARQFFDAFCGRDAEFVASEIVRYLGWPGQAISYKLGERAWLAGRAAAREARGASFDLKAWHMAALSLGALGLDDLTAELARL